MYRLFIVLFFAKAFLCADIGAQKIVAVTFADTDDQTIGNGCAIDQNNFKKYCRYLKALLGYELKEVAYTNDDFIPGNFDSFQSQLKTTDKDILLFYNSCHGVRSVYDKIVFPQLKFSSNEYRSVYFKHALLATLPHKILLTLVDACNAARNISQQERQMYGKIWSPFIAETITDLEKKNCQKIFKTKFDLIVTSSQPNVVSLTTKTGGSVFSNCFFASFKYFVKLSNQRVVNIESILKKTNEDTYAESLRLYVNNEVPQYGENQAHHPEWEFDRKVDDDSVSVEDILVDTLTQRYQIVYSLQDLANGSTKKIRNRYKVVLSIRNDDGQMDDIKGVRYYLHYTFKRPIVNATDRANNYRYTLYLWGAFLVKADIILKNGQSVSISKYLDLEPDTDNGNP